MRVLVTGYLGFIGSHTVEALLADGHDVIGADNGTVGHRDNIRGFEDRIEQHLPGDIVTHAELIIRNTKPDAIIHLAAQPSLLTSWQNPVYDAEVNILGTLRLAEAATKLGVEKFVFSSTSAVYAASERSPYRESNTRLGPERPYGVSKLAGETYVRLFAPNPVILRYGNVFGPRQIPLGDNQIVPRLLSCIYNNTKFEIYGTGEQSRDFIYVRDVVEANLAALNPAIHGTFNVSNNEGVSVNEIVKMVSKSAGYSGGFKRVAAKDNEPDEVVMDNHLAKAFLHWRPRYLVEDGIAETVKWWQENKCPKR